MIDRLKARAVGLKRQTYTVYFVVRDPRTPWYARALALLVVAYALSPIDLIPDFVPVLGYVDDLILVPAGIALVLRLVPSEVLADCSERARLQSQPMIGRLGAVLIVAVWLVAAAWLVVTIHGLLT